MLARTLKKNQILNTIEWKSIKLTGLIRFLLPLELKLCWNVYCILSLYQYIVNFFWNSININFIYKIFSDIILCWKMGYRTGDSQYITIEELVKWECLNCLPFCASFLQWDSILYYGLCMQRESLQWYVVKEWILQSNWLIRQASVA